MTCPYKLQLRPEPVPGGSLIGSVKSQFAAAAITICQKVPRIETQSSNVSSLPTYNSFDPIANEPPEDSATEPSVDATLVDVIQNLPRGKIESLVTLAWIRNIPNQSDDKLRTLVAGAVKRGILNYDDIESATEGSIICLPTGIQIKILCYLPLRQRIVFLTALNKDMIRLANHPELWRHLDLKMPFQSTLSSLSKFLAKHCPANSVESLSFPSSTRSLAFLRFLVTLKQLRSRLAYIHLSGKEVTRTNLSAMESLLGSRTHTIIIENPSTKVGLANITTLVSAAPRLKTFALHTSTTFIRGEEYTMYLRGLLRAGETERLYQEFPEQNTRLRTLHLSTSTLFQKVKFEVLADLGNFFPLLEMLRIENWKVILEGNEVITPIASLRGLSLVGFDIVDQRKSSQPFEKVLSEYVASFPSLEILFLGARDMDYLGLKLFIRRPELCSTLSRLGLSKLKVLWLRSWQIDCDDLMRLTAGNLKWLIIEECKGMNGGRMKALRSKWKGIVVHESEGRLKDGINLFTLK